ncbi:MAG: ATP-binding protein [Chloroflexi bacterium]|nr:ATP-binding protein [Chloroflexota bacterium]
MRKGGSNWVDGEDFFDRETELEALSERVREGAHTLLTAQRRMGKTSVVRELQRRLWETGEFERVFVDVEAAMDPADAIAEIGVQARPLSGVWERIKGGFTNFFQDAGDHVEELAVADIKVKLRAGIDAGNWQERGNAIFAALASSDRPIILALDELPILVNRLLRDDEDRITVEGRREADAFLSWLRRAGQAHRGQVMIVLSGSVGLEPLLEQARLSAHANIFSAYDLKPWSEETAAACLAELAESYGVGLPPEVREDMCRRLRCCIPHHVQMFFEKLHDHLRRADQTTATMEDAKQVYLHDLLSVRGQMDLQHYEGRLEMALGRAGYPVALEMLTETAVKGRLDGETVNRYRAHFASDIEDATPSVEDVLHVLEHDGYLERFDGSYRFVSGLLEDWWRGRHGGNFESAVGAERRGPGADR